jgi:hypothetical protein
MSVSVHIIIIAHVPICRSNCCKLGSKNKHEAHFYILIDFYIIRFGKFRVVVISYVNDTHIHRYTSIQISYGHAQ